MSNRPTAGSRPLRIFYAAGPGDVVKTYRHWAEGRDDPHELAVTYSGQFYDVCHELGAEAYVVSSCPRAEILEDGPFHVENRPMRSKSWNGPIYALGQFARVLTLSALAKRYRADVAVVGGIEYWFLLSILSAFGMQVVPTLHCAFWPVTRPPQRWTHRLLHQFNGWFFRRHAGAVLCVSPECERQLRAIAGPLGGPVLQSRAQYRSEVFETLPPSLPPSVRPFRVLFAGRIERSKGVFDLLRAAESLERSHPGQFCWQICGLGGAKTELAAEARNAGLAARFQLRGHLSRPEMQEELGRSHVVVVPTTSGFAEGLAKVAVEAVVAGRPLVTSVLSNACDILGEAVVEVSPDDPEAYAEALRRLASDPEYYDRVRHASSLVRAQFFDPSRGWSAALKTALNHVCGGRAEAAVSCEVPSAAGKSL